MRIMTWNVQGRVGDWEARPAALRSWIERTTPDVLTLQKSWVEPNGTTQAALLGEELDMHSVTAANPAAVESVWASDHFAVVAEVKM